MLCACAYDRGPRQHSRYSRSSCCPSSRWTQRSTRSFWAAAGRLPRPAVRLRWHSRLPAVGEMELGGRGLFSAAASGERLARTQALRGCRTCSRQVYTAETQMADTVTGVSPPEPGSTLPTSWSARHAEAACACRAAGAHNANSGQTLSNTGALKHAPTGGRHTKSAVPHSQRRCFMAGDRRCTRPVALHQGPCRAHACDPRRPGLHARRLQQCAIPNPHPTSVCTPCSACEEAALA